MLKQKIVEILAGEDIEPDARDRIAGKILAAVSPPTAAGEAKANVKRRRSLFRSIIDSFPDHIYYQDLEGVLIGGNTAFARWAGFADSGELAGHAQAELYDAELSARLADLDDNVLNFRTSITTEVREVEEPDLVQFWEIRKAPLLDESGRMAGIIGVKRNITNRKDAEEKLQEALAILESVIDANPDLIIFKNRDDTIIHCNQAYADILGMEKLEIIGEKAPRLFPGEAVSAGENVRGRLIRELRLTRDGRERFFEALSTDVTAPSGEIVGRLETARDITVRKTTELALLKAQDEVTQNHDKLKQSMTQVEAYANQAAAANKAKSAFLANMSHEIRTPLNGVLGMINLLLGTPLDELQQRYAEMAKSSGESLLGLINDILDFAKIESGRMEMENMAFTLQDALEDVADIISHRIQEKKLELVHYLKPGTPEMVRGDLGRVRQILVNLAGNAVKFTQVGSITLEVSLRQDLGDSLLILFKVIDTGIGIAHDKIPALFKPFTQADTSTTRRFGGTGLGLSICHQLVKLMHGEIGLESEEGRGSTFWFTLRLGKVPPPETLKPVSGQLPGLTLVFAPAAAQVTPRLNLENLGLSVLATDDLERALQLAGKNAVDAVLVDYNVGFEAALSLAGQLPAHFNGRSPRLLALLPPVGFKDEVRQLREAGYDALLTKPLKQADFLAALSGGSFTSAKAGFGLLARPHHGADAKPHEFRLLLVEDSPVNQLVAQGYLKRLGYTSDAVANGREALEALARLPYDLVLMDCQMPEMDGYEATAMIRGGRSSVLNPQVPIIAMTAHAMSGDREKCLAAGMSDYLSKPIEPKRLREMLKQWLS